MAGQSQFRSRASDRSAFNVAGWCAGRAARLSLHVGRCGDRTIPEMSAPEGRADQMTAASGQDRRMEVAG